MLYIAIAICMTPSLMAAFVLVREFMRTLLEIEDNRGREPISETPRTYMTQES